MEEQFACGQWPPLQPNPTLSTTPTPILPVRTRTSLTGTGRASRRRPVLCAPPVFPIQLLTRQISRSLHLVPPRELQNSHVAVFVCHRHRHRRRHLMSPRSLQISHSAAQQGVGNWLWLRQGRSLQSASLPLSLCYWSGRTYTASSCRDERLLAVTTATAGTPIFPHLVCRRKFASK